MKHERTDATLVLPPSEPSRRSDDATLVLPLPERSQHRDASALPRPTGRPHDPDATVLYTREPTGTETGTATDTETGTETAAPPRSQRGPALALPEGFTMHEYRIEHVLGQGGFGITYLATDVHLNAPVAIKEYLPEQIAFRAGDRSVSPSASSHRDRYRQGLESFLGEARTLASFRHPAIVRVARYFEAHRTAYMVLEYERGSAFRLWWPLHPKVDEAGLVELLLPLLDGLEAVHNAGFLHRDIKPDNIQVRADDGQLVLLDFGSAGQTLAAASDGLALTPGYAPIEQYGSGAQGPWTDLYAFGATLYWAVCGRKPPDAEQRIRDPGCYRPAAEVGVGRFGSAFLKAIDWALQPVAADRPQSVAEFRRALCTDHLGRIDLVQALQGNDEPVRSKGKPTPRWRARLLPRHWPLALKLTLAMLATALLPMLMTGAYNLRGSQQAVSAAELRHVEQMAHSTAARVAQMVADSGNLARAIATDPALPTWLATRNDAQAVATMNARLAQLAKADPNVQLLMLMGSNGRALSSSDTALVGRDFSFRQYFQAAMAGRSFVTGLTVGAGAGEAGIFFSEPVRDAAGAVAGALVLRVRGAAVAAILQEVQRDSKLTPFMVDGDGVLVHHPRRELLYSSLMPLPAATLKAILGDQRFRRSEIMSLDEPELAAAMLGAKATGNVSYRSTLNRRDEIAGYAPVAERGWVVGVSEARDTFEAPLRTLADHLLLSLGLVGLLFTGLALRFARSIVQPVRELTKAARALKAGDYEAAHVTSRSRDEIGQLARTFNVMIDVLRQRDREQRRKRP